MLSFLLSLAFPLFATPSTSEADTLRPETLCVEGPYIIRTSETAETENVASVMRRNKKLTCATMQTASVPNGAALYTDSVPTGEIHLRSVRFCIDAPRFTKAKVETPMLKNALLLLNDEEVPLTSFSLPQGRHNLTLLIASTHEHLDTLSFSLIAHGVKEASGQRLYTMDDLLYGDHVSRPRLSPSGKYVCFTYYDTKRDGRADYRLEVAEAESGRVVYTSREHTDAGWLPTSDELYWTQEQGPDRTRILVAFDPVKRTERTLTTTLPKLNYTLVLNSVEPFALLTEEDKSKVPTRPNLDGLRLHKNTEDVNERQPAPHHLYRQDLATGLTRRLTTLGAEYGLGAVSRDGRYMLAERNWVDVRKEHFDRMALVRIDLTTGAVDTLFADTCGIASAQFGRTPDEILLVSHTATFGRLGSELAEGKEPNHFHNSLFAYDVPTRTPRFLLPRGFKPSVVGRSLYYSESDGILYFRGDAGYDVNLYCLDLANEALPLVQIPLPLTNIGAYTVSRRAVKGKSPRIVATGATGTTARRAISFLAPTMPARNASVTAPRCTEIQHLLDANRLDDVYISPLHPYAFTTQRGDTIEGYYYLPRDVEEGRAPAASTPVIVYYYGGCSPTSAHLEFAYPLSVFCARGYVVLALNPSGCAGYGQEFAARHVGTWGERTAADIIEGTRELLRRIPAADSTKIGCIGASYGGFMTEYLQTQTDLFAAAVSHAGISNITSYWGGGTWGYTYGQTAQMGQYPWNNPSLYTEHSPLFLADRIHTPLLLIHGTVDNNVPPTESRQLFTALQILNRPAAWLTVDGENHVIQNHKKRATWQRAIFAWFDRWLRGAPDEWDAMFEEK